ncbi:hypothetical protein COL516b_011929 [Colletotrichum fioriniae]|nr:uncharacterized protein COL516b_011929 [Colletotrichum fioriniae]KAJ0296077.1 hypothetical protein COL516b_011929 [Colletotrichum fioriniae]
MATEVLDVRIFAMFAAFYMANYFGRGFFKVLDFFVSEPTVPEPVKPLGPEKVEEPGKFKESGKKERLETIEELDEEEESDEVEKPPAPASNQPQQGGCGNRGKKARNKKNKRKGKR